MLILLTGATGFLGAHLALQLLDAGHQVRALYRSQAKRDHHPLFTKAIIDQIDWVEGDLFDQSILLKAMEGVDRVYHCAAMVSFGRGQQAALMRTNVAGTAEVVNNCLVAGVPRLVYVSSIAALGRDPLQPKVSESTPWKDGPHNSPYALSKFRAENEVWRGMEEGLEVVIVNPSVILGPGDWLEGSNRLFRTVYQGLKVYSPGQTGFVDVRDVADAMIQLDKGGHIGKRFLLNGANLAYKTLFDTIAKAFGVKPPQWCPPRWMSEVGWRFFAITSFFTRKEPFITRETVKSAYNSFEYDGSKISREIGFSYRPIETTIQESCAFMRKHFIDSLVD
jgi:nucleoside-diphosphate-sugar epimerase